MSSNTDRNTSSNQHYTIGGVSSGMTPSIITTINNTSPTPPANYPSIVNNNNNNNNNCNSSRSRRNTEPYESYIEDSFVGHWEREDDDVYHEEGDDDDINNGTEHNDSGLQHPSTIEFDFDSFGPESFIYTPAASTTNPTSIATSPMQEVLTASSSNISKEAQPETVIDQNVQVKPQAQNAELQKPRRLNVSPIEYIIDPEQIDLKVIEPYKKVISHAGYCHHFDSTMPASNLGDPAPAIIVFSACYLPDRSRRDYDYVMDHLFLYVLSSLHELIADDYILIYLHNTQPSASTTSSQASSGCNSSSNVDDAQRSNNLPTFTWMKRCYQMIDRRLRKNLRILYLVKPTFWLKTIVIMCKPFISAKFSKKLRFVESMDALRKCLPVDKLILPASAGNI